MTQNMLTCATRTDLEGILPAASAAVLLTETNRVGQFVWMSGDYSAQVVADPNQALFVKANSVATIAGAWMRQIPDGRYLVDWWRTAGATMTQDTAAVKAAIESVPSGATLVF